DGIQERCCTKGHADALGVRGAEALVVALGVAGSLMGPRGDLESPEHGVDAERQSRLPQSRCRRLNAVLQLVRIDHDLVHEALADIRQVVRATDANDVMERSSRWRHRPRRLSVRRATLSRITDFSAYCGHVS